MCWSRTPEIARGITVKRKSNPKEATIEAHGLIHYCTRHGIEFGCNSPAFEGGQGNFGLFGGAARARW
jgi:hypothetical protein